VRIPPKPIQPNQLIQLITNQPSKLNKSNNGQCAELNLMNIDKAILLTIDVEDWFQVENFRPWIPFETWDQRELRVERNVHQLLNLFDSIELIAHSSKPTAKTAHSSQLIVDSQEEKDYELSAISYELKDDEQLTTDNGRTKKVKATFFVLGWIAERLPHLIREIRTRGHEIASHGYNHNLCNRQPHADLKRELTTSRKLLEDITGFPVSGFRAPNFSIDDETLKIIEDCGYHYDSSYNSFGLHGRYGKISLNGHRKKGIALQISDNFFELPISNLMLKGRTFPLGGGGYFRLIPFPLFSIGLKNILKKEGAYIFYIHPWELDPEQPRVVEASCQLKFRHYTNLSRTGTKLGNLFEIFKSCRFITCSEYLKGAGKLYIKVEGHEAR
jgi:polysaccharide deacetylase family protein (PEP-CTERM system associated)